MFSANSNRTQCFVAVVSCTQRFVPKDALFVSVNINNNFSK